MALDLVDRVPEELWTEVCDTIWEAVTKTIPKKKKCKKAKWLSVFCPMSESLSGKREGFQDNAIHKKGSLLLTRVRAFCRNQRSGAGSEKALSRGCYPNL